MEVKFYDTCNEELLKFAVIVSRFQDQWVFVKHRKRDTLEIPGGKRELGESILACAKRELYEETGADIYELEPVCVYSVKRDGEDESFGMLYIAQIEQISMLPESEIEHVELLDELPKENWTYPEIQPLLCEYIIQNH